MRNSVGGTGLPAAFAFACTRALTVSFFGFGGGRLRSASLRSSPSSFPIFSKCFWIDPMRFAVLGSISSVSSSAAAANSRKPRATFLSFLACSTIFRISPRTTLFVESAR